MDKNLLLEWDKKYVWHPFTQMQEYENEDTLMVEYGEGSYLYDLDGNKYLDGVSSIWLTVHGHRREEINAAIKEQLDKVNHSTLLGLANIPSTVLAKMLVDITPAGLNKVFFSDDGSTSVEAALKMAYQYWQQKSVVYKKKTKFLSLVEGYHGDTIGSISVGGVELFHQIFKPLMFEGYKACVPYCYRCPLGKQQNNCALACADEVEKILAKHHAEIVALIMEPEVIAAGGMITVPRGYLKKMRELCTKYEVLLILDEVAVGFGRTGKMFACEHEAVIPDILCLSKGITGGYLPLGATIATTEIYNRFLGPEIKKFTHGHSYTGNQLSSAAAVANLKIFDKEKTLAKMQEKIIHLQKGLERFHELKHIGDIRQRGFMVGIELVKDKKTKEPYPSEYHLGNKVISAARKKGLILRPIVDVIEIVPHLTATTEELDIILNITFAAIKVVTEK